MPFVPLLPNHESYEYGERPRAGEGHAGSVTVTTTDERPIGFAPWPEQQEPEPVQSWFLSEPSEQETSD